MNKWKDTIKQFYDILNQGEGLHSVKDLCRSFLEEPHASFWEGKEIDEVVKYIEDWLDVSQCKLEFHSRWIKKPNMNNIVNYDEQEINKVKELISLLKRD